MIKPNYENTESNNEDSQLTVVELDAVNGGAGDQIKRELESQETMSHLQKTAHDLKQTIVRNIRG